MSEKTKTLFDDFQKIQIKSESLLVKSLLLHEHDEMVLEVFECSRQDGTISHLDLNRSLNLAVCRPTTAIAEKLLQYGADIDFQDENEWTPLHCAIDAWNLEAVCMLLYYNADVSISCDDLCPLFRAIYYKRLDIVEVLIDYCFDEQDIADAIFYLTKLESPFAFNIKFKDFVNLPDEIRWGILCDCLIEKPGTAHTVKAAISTMDTNNCIELPTFISLFLCPYQRHEIMDCIFAILQSPFITELVECTNEHIKLRPNEIHVIGHLMFYFVKHYIDQETRLNIIYFLLSVGFETTLKDIASVYYCYKFGAEFVALIYASRIHWPRNIYMPRLQYRRGITNLSKENILCICTTYYADEALALIVSYLVPNHKNSALEETHLVPSFEQIQKKLKKVSLFPSLCQLSKLEVRRCLIRSHQYSRAYEYLDAVKQLELPKTLHDSIIFKEILDILKC